MSNQWLMIKQLDRQLNEWKTISKKYPMPRVGWVKTLRVALRMTIEQLAHRLGLTRARVAQLEQAEPHDAVTLRSLREAARAMECDFIYAFIPKGNLSLEEIIKDRAKQVANERVARVAHSMSLEAQSIDDDVQRNQQDELAKNLAEHLNKKLWAVAEDKIEKQKFNRKKKRK